MSEHDHGRGGTPDGESAAPDATKTHEHPFDRLASAAAPDRALGALLGMAVGDALGTTLEFLALEAPAFPLMAPGPHRQMIGKGPFAEPVPS